MDTSFHPGHGPELVDYAELLATGVVRGRTGRVLAAGDPNIASAVAGVRAVTALPGGVLRIEVDGDDLRVARALHATPGIDWAIPDLRIPLTLTALPDDPYLSAQWHLENTGQDGRTVDSDIDAATAWEFATGAGQLIAIVDSGTQLDHPDLVVIPGHDYVDGDDSPDPGADTSNAHGTGTAGIAAAVGDNGYGVAGVAWGAEVYAVRLIGGNTSLEDLYNVFVESVDAGAGVISNSWGFGTSCERIPNYSVFEDMFTYAEEQGRGGLGTVVTFAAGNSGCDIQTDGMLRNETPIVIAALEGTDTRAGYSNYGASVDLAAPTSLLTTDIVGGYGSHDGDDLLYPWFSGTSGATPVVSGVVALMLEANPRLTAAQVREVLCETAVKVDLELADYDAEGRSPYYGCGRVDAGAAVAAVANTAPAAPVPRLVADTAEVPRVMLAWEPAVDPDGDVWSYVVRYTIGDRTAELSTEGTTVDLAAEVVVGDVITWTVAAIDAWGEGPSSEALTLTVVAAPTAPVLPAPKDDEDSGGCASAAGPAPLWALAATALLRRRVSRPRAPRAGTAR